MVAEPILPPTPPPAPRTCKGTRSLLDVILKEPQGPLLAKLLGCNVVEGRVPPEGIQCLRVHGVDGSWLEIVREAAEGRKCLDADAPLARGPRVYRGPFHVTVKGVKVLADAMVIDGGILRSCRVGVGCTTRARFDRVSQRIETGCYRPRLAYPVAYAVHRVRVRRQLGLRVPWLCLQCGGKVYTLVCGKGLCDLTITGNGVIESAHDLYMASTKTCSPTALYRLIASRLWTSDEPKATLEIMNALPVTVEGAGKRPGIEVRLWVWNPSSIAVQATVRLRGYRIISARVFNTAHNLWEELKPLANMVRVPLRQWGLNYLELKARKTLL